MDEKKRTRLLGLVYRALILALLQHAAVGALGGATKQEEFKVHILLDGLQVVILHASI